MSSPSVPSLRVASIPLASRRGDAAWNVERVAQSLARAASQNVNLAVFPETCLAGYASMTKLSRAELEALAEPLDGASIRAVADAVEQTGVAAGVGFVERATDGRLFNSYVVCLPGGERHCHRKLHAFEHRRICSGDRFTVFDTSWGMRVGILIGADNYLVENARMTALMGTTLLVAPHRSFGGGRSGRLQPLSIEQARLAASDRHTRDDNATDDALRRWLPARASDNGMFIAFSDGSAGHDDSTATGTGMIVDPRGRTLAASVETGETGETGQTRDPRDASAPIVSASLEMNLIDASAGHQSLAARRPDLYGLLGRPGRLATDFEPRSASPHGSIALSFAQVGRNRVIG